MSESTRVDNFPLQAHVDFAHAESLPKTNPQDEREISRIFSVPTEGISSISQMEALLERHISQRSFASFPYENLLKTSKHCFSREGVIPGVNIDKAIETVLHFMDQNPHLSPRQRKFVLDFLEKLQHIAKWLTEIYGAMDGLQKG